MKKLVLLAATAATAVAVLRRRRRQATLKGRLLDFIVGIRGKL
jgi:hypothetical protein